MADRVVRLAKLLEEVPFLADRVLPEVLVSGIVSDSRQVEPGSLFVAHAGGSVDGHRFIPDALERGAVAIVGTQPLQDLPVPYIRVDNSRQALPRLAAAFYGFPARKLTVIGVTGTDGKTTTTNLIYKILEAAGSNVGMISTVNAVIGDQVLDTGFHVTTPDAPDVQRYLAQMVQAGLTHVVLESTSHGLAQYRIDACEFDVGVVTNITHEHLDYHGSYEAYRAAKGRLFSMLAETKEKQQGNPRLAILNRDDDSYAYLSNLTTVRQVSYGFHPQAEVRVEDVRHQPDGMQFVAIGPGFRFPVNCHLVGDYNISNCLGAIAATVVALGVQSESAQAGIAALEGVAGGMERMNLGQDFTAIVDFAHTPNALRRSLEAARQMTKGRVIAVFGSAGLRDRQKRRMMAETSVELADLTILTAEDPRTESLDDILREMASGAEAKNGIEGETFWRVPDRGEAIRLAVVLARPGDLVIACGKGHEQSMCFGETEYPWDDRIAMRSALSDLLGIPGPEMPYLPTQSENQDN
jgi:UDP-N-acetylmuramoyl-L-alanyl-D-glutamate--2,6-diaminopimelate ligase